MLAQLVRLLARQAAAEFVTSIPCSSAAFRE
jgi:hypothetical protein